MSSSNTSHPRGRPVSESLFAHGPANPARIPVGHGRGHDLVVSDTLIPRAAPHQKHTALLPLTLAILLHAAIVAAFLAYVPRPLPLVEEPLIVTMIFAPAAPPATPPPPKPAPPPQPAPEPAPPVVVPAPQPIVRPPVKPVPHPPKRVVKPRPVQHFVRRQPVRSAEPRPRPRSARTEAAIAALPSNTPPPAAPVSAPISAGWRDALIGWLARHKTYPEAARRDGIQGRVVVRFTAARDGRVENVALLQSSGQRILDDAAETMLRRARLPPFPASMPQQSITVTLPLTYHLEN